MQLRFVSLFILKEETMRLMRSSGKPVAQISRELDVCEHTL